MTHSNPTDTNNEELRRTKVDWSTPYDDWLIPILNRARHCGPIEFRALASEIQLHIEKRDASRDQQIALAARLRERLDFIDQMLGDSDWNIPSESPDRPLLTDRMFEVLYREREIVLATLKEQETL